MISAYVVINRVYFVCVVFNGTSAQKGHWRQEVVVKESTSFNTMQLMNYIEKVHSKTDSVHAD